MSATNVLNQPTRKPGAFEKRIHEVDFLRGILICLVLLDHILNAILTHSHTWYEITGNVFYLNLFNDMNWYWTTWPRNLVRYIALILFCFVSGLSCAFSRNNWKRAGEMLVLWFVLFIGGRCLSNLGLPFNTCIDFNIIGVLAWSTLFYCFIQNCSWKGKLASTLLWFLASTVLMGFINSIPNVHTLYCPPLVDPDYIKPQADWMPLVPYISFFFLGATITSIIYKEKKSLLKRHEFERPVCFVGRHTLWIYLGHQAVLLPLFFAIDAIMRAIHG